MSDIVDSSEWSQEDEAEAANELKALRTAETAGNHPVASTAPDAQPATETQVTETVPTATETPPPAQTPEPDDQAKKKEQLESEIEELRKRKRDLAGEVGGELDRRARQQNAELQAQLQQARAELEALRQQQKPPLTEIDDKILFDGMDESQKDPNDPVVSMATRMTRNAVGHVAKRFQEQLEQQQRTMQAQLAQDRADRFTDSVEAIEPGFRQVNAYDGQPVDPEWVQHLDDERPGTVETWRHFIETSRTPAKAAAEAFRAMKTRKEGPKPVEKKPVADPSRQVAPSRSTTSLQPQPTGSESVEDQLFKLQRDYDKGLIDEEEFEKKSGPLLKKRG